MNPCKKTTIQRTTLGKQNVSKKGKRRYIFRRTSKTSFQDVIHPRHYQLHPHANSDAGQRFAGSIIFDTEAQTLSTANHLDCGNFDDMLRKAFEHENIDSSYKANGISPVYIRHPKLALLLTGTPGQIDSLLSSCGNGLPSRILTYTFREIPHWKEMGDDCISLEDSSSRLLIVSTNYIISAWPILFYFISPVHNGTV